MCFSSDQFHTPLIYKYLSLVKIFTREKDIGQYSRSAVGKQFCGGDIKEQMKPNGLVGRKAGGSMHRSGEFFRKGSIAGPGAAAVKVVGFGIVTDAVGLAFFSATSTSPPDRWLR